MFATLKELAGKKRFWLPAIGTGVVTMVTALLYQLGLPESIILWVVGIIGGLFGVGGLNNAAADLGKEAAKVNKPQ